MIKWIKNIFKHEPEHFSCAKCDRNYPWKHGITGLKLNGELYCIPCYIQRLYGLIQTQACGYPSYTWHDCMKQLSKIFDMNIHGTNDPKKYTVTLLNGGYRYSVTINPNKWKYHDWKNKFTWIKDLLTNLESSIIPIKPKGHRISHGNAGNPDC